MSYIFEGQTFATQKAFGEAYPAYRGYGDLIRDDVTTLMELEIAIHERKQRARAAGIKAARNNAKLAGNKLRLKR